MSETTTTPPAGTSAETVDNAAFYRMRTELEAATKAVAEAAQAKADLEKQLDEIRRAEMTEKQKLEADLKAANEKASEAERLRDEHGKFMSEFKELYDSRLAAVPEEKRALVQQVSTAGTWPERVKAIDAAIGLMGITPTPVVGGTVTQPGSPPPPTVPAAPETPKPAAPLTPEELKKADLRSIMDARREGDPIYTAWGKKPQT